MPLAIQVPGPALIQVDTGAAHALESLGYTRDGAVVRFDNYFVDVPVDTHGGEQGPPADIQNLGSTALITLDLTKFDEAVAVKIRTAYYGAYSADPQREGFFATTDVGVLMLGGAVAWRLVIASPILPYDFPTVVFREPKEINRGSKYSTYRLEGTAYRNPADNYLYKKYANSGSIPALYV